MVFTTCDLKATMIFGKKPKPRGEGDREGEREKEAAPGGSRARRAFWKEAMRETEWEIPPARAGEMVV